ncbi:hypothetical protein RB596_000327 [Gaeumannomyces avenae]
MCEWTDREYSCGHHRFVAAEWCSKFIRTRLWCKPQVENYEYGPTESCGDCVRKCQEPVAWEYMIKRKEPA